MSIYLPLSKLSQWQQVAFSAALLERMLPNYQLFSETEQFGDYAVVRNQLDSLWQWLDKNNRSKINFTAQLNKLEEQTPNPELFDAFGVFPALDFCMALMSLFQSIQDKENDNLDNIGRLSENSVSFYVELLLAEALEDDALEISIEDINNHPLMQWEIATQNELFDFLKDASENKQTCLEIKALALEEGLSNLGIEITG